MHVNDVNELFLLIHMLNIRVSCFQHRKKGERVKYCWIQQIQNLLKRWVLNVRINICTPKYVEWDEVEIIEKRKPYSID